MKAVPLKQILQEYDITSEQWQELRYNSGFIADVKYWLDELKKKDGSFRIKAKLQAEELLKHSWSMATNSDTPAPVRADLIKWTARVAGLEPKPGAFENAAGEGGGFNIIIQMNNEVKA